MKEVVNMREGRRSLEIKDVYGGMPGISAGRHAQTLPAVQRSKRTRIKVPRALLVPNVPTNIVIKSLELKATPKDGDGDGWILDGKPGMRPTPAGATVVGDLTYVSAYEPGGDTAHVVKDGHGDTYVVLPDDEDGGFTAVGEPDDVDDFWDDIAVQEAATRKEAMELLDAATRQKRKPGAKPVNGSLSDNPTKINIPKRSSGQREADKQTTTAAQRAAQKRKQGSTPATSAAKRAKTTAKKASAAKKTTRKPSTRKPAAPKEKKIPAWQRKWSELTAEEKAGQIASRGKVPEKNNLTGKEWTAQAIKLKRAANFKKGEKSLEDVIKRHQDNGWRLVTDDAERHSLSMKVGKPMPPGWSHVFVYEGPKSLKDTVTGIDWAYKIQPHQSPASRAASLDNKFVRYRKLVKKLPALDKRTKADTLKGDVTATVVRLMMLSGGRVDSGGGENVTGSRGITSLQARDVIVKGDLVSLNFDAKSGHKNDYKVRDAALATELKALLDNKAPTDRIFPKSVNATTTAAYIKSVVGAEFTNHDLRTAVANAAAQKAIGAWLREGGVVYIDDVKSVKAAVDAISKQVGVAINDTPTTAYNSYMDPALFTQMGIPENVLPKRGAK